MIDRIRFLASWVYGFLYPIIRELLSDRGRDLAAVAREVVSKLEDTNLSGAERRAAAVQQIRHYFRSQWPDLPTTLLHAVLEAAVVEVRARRDDE